MKPTSDGERFIFLWIAFNAAYGLNATDTENLTQRSQFIDFLRKVLVRDAGNEIERIIWGHVLRPDPHSSREPVRVRTVLEVGAGRARRRRLA